jgi:hypothetical protein
VVDFAVEVVFEGGGGDDIGGDDLLKEDVCVLDVLPTL